MTVKAANGQDWERLRGMGLLPEEELCRGARTGYLLWEQEEPAGWLEYSLLWGRVPFLNHLFVREEYRGRGFATRALAHWEREMRRLGCPMVLLSTRADESAQHLYRKRGYQDCGVLLLDGTPLEQPAELFFRKVLSEEA